MKTTNSLAIGLAGVLCLGVFSARADVEVFASMQIRARADFYAPLGAHGVWVDVGPYGRCWRPSGVAVEWRPYSYGHWVWTDCGWYWASDEPWGWACYHYGQWVYLSDQGWVWVPDIEWAPAWVSWRVGGGYVGWAPMAPRGGFSVSFAAPALPFVFVEMGRFHEPMRPSTVIVNNTTIINKTTVISNVRQETRTFGNAGAQKVMVNEGPGLAPIEKATGKKMHVVAVQDAVRQTPVPPSMQRHLERQMTPSKSTGKPSDPESAREHRPAKGDVPEIPRKASPPDGGKSTPGVDISPGPDRSPTPDAAPDKSGKSSHGKGKGKGKDRL
jgi:hypothetical protein